MILPDPSPPRPSEYIPPELKLREQWVMWRYEEREGKKTKVPYNSRTGRRASATDASTWCLLIEALEAYESDPRWDGIGFVFTENDPLAGIDLEHRLLPNVIVGPAAVVGFALSFLESPERWWIYPISALAVAGGLLALALAYPGGMGMGDVKMGGMLGAFLGPYAALAVFLGALAGAIAGGLLIATGRIRRRHALPFGVFMALGGIVALFVGPQLWELYLDLLVGL